MSLFGAISTSSSGIDAAQTWIDAVAGNIANANDTVPTSQSAYQEEQPIFTPVAPTDPGAIGSGVEVSGVALGSGEGQLVSDPTSPLADSQGMVRTTSVDLGTQLVDLVQAQDTYEANSATMHQAITAYQSALTLGT